VGERKGSRGEGNGGERRKTSGRRFELGSRCSIRLRPPVGVANALSEKEREKKKKRRGVIALCVLEKRVFTP